METRKKSIDEVSGKKTAKGPSRREQPLCSVPDCRRPNYARGHCQTHHQHLKATGEVRDIRPYRARIPGTVKLAGLRLSPECASLLQQSAGEGGVSLSSAISTALEETVAEGWPTKKRTKRAPVGDGRCGSIYTIAGGIRCRLRGSHSGEHEALVGGKVVRWRSPKLGPPRPPREK